MPFYQGRREGGYSSVEYQILLIRLSAEIPTIGFLLEKLTKLRNTSTVIQATSLRYVVDGAIAIFWFTAVSSLDSYPLGGFSWSGKRVTRVTKVEKFPSIPQVDLAAMVGLRHLGKLIIIIPYLASNTSLLGQS